MSTFGAEGRVTYRELYATILGVVVGSLVGYAHLVGRASLATDVAVLFVVFALGVAGGGRLSTARVTIRREPWYALAAFPVGAVAVVALFGGATAMVG